MRAISLGATILYGMVAVVLTTFPTILATGYLSWIAEWWGVVTAGYLFLTALPVAVIACFYANTKDSWKWKLGHADTIASYYLVAKILILVPLINWAIPGPMLYWQWKIWLISAFAAGVDLLIALISDACERNAPDGAAAAGAAGAAPAGGAGHHP